MTLTFVAYGAGRLQHRFSDGAAYIAGTVFGLTVLGQVIFVLLGTLFGQGTISEPGVISKILLPGLWNLVLTVPVFWVLDKTFRARESGWAV